MKGNRVGNTDWNAQFLFLRSKSSPHLYLLNNRRSSFPRQANHAASFDSAALANELLRIDLYSFFTEMASWHLYYRKCRPVYILPDRNYRNRSARIALANGHNLVNKRMRHWKRLELTPYIDRVDGHEFNIIVFSDRSEYDRWRKSQPPLSPDFKMAIDRALANNSSGNISASTKELLTGACSICLKCDSASVPDPLYYSYLFGTIAAECAEIDKLLALACSDKDLIKRYHATDLFDSYLSLERHESERVAKNYLFELTDEPGLMTYRPTESFANFFRVNKTPFLASHDLDYLQSLYATMLQTCLIIAKKSQNNSINKMLNELEAQTIQAYIDTSITELGEMTQELDSIICLSSKLLSSLGTRSAFDSDIATFVDLSGELRELRASDYFCSLAHFAKNPIRKPLAEASEEEKFKYEIDSRRYKSLHRSAYEKTYGPLVQIAALDNHQASLEQIKRQAVIRYAENTCLLETEWSFSKFYARLLSELLNCGKIPIRCKSCGSLFFPTGSNSQYCDRFDPTTNLYCNPRLNEKKHLGRKAPHGTAINLHKKAVTAKQLNEKKRHAYFAELEEFVDHEIGPVYFKSTLITDDLYQSWRAAINTPKNQPKAKTPEQLAFPHPVIWEDRVIDGNQEIAVYLNQYVYPALRDKLDQRARLSKSSCTVIDKPTIRFGGWKLRLFDLLRLIASINNDKEQIQDGPIPVPGLGPMDTFAPDRSPLEPWPEGRERFLRFPSSGKEHLVLFEIIGEMHSKRL